MEITEEKNPTKATIKEIREVLTLAFMHNPLIGTYIFHNNQKQVAAFMNLTMKYYSRRGRTFTLRDDEGRIQAVAIWDVPNGGTLSVSTLIASGIVFSCIKPILTMLPQGSFSRLCKTSDILLSYHKKIPQPQYFLYNLASISKGCGRTLLNHCIQLFSGNTMYWESSVSKNNHEYYKSFPGAQMLDSISIGGVSTGFFIIKS